MKTRSDHSNAFSTASHEEFLELFEFAGTCDMANSDPKIEPAQFAFITILLQSFKRWQIDTGLTLDVMPSVQYVLGFEQLRRELTEVLFKHGSPTESQIETAFRLLFQLAYIRQQLVTKADVGPTNSP